MRKLVIGMLVMRALILKTLHPIESVGSLFREDALQRMMILTFYHGGKFKVEILQSTAIDFIGYPCLYHIFRVCF